MTIIILPAYNEEKNIKDVIIAIKQIFQENNMPFLIIVVNDGSTDNTKEIVENLITEYPIKIINFERNMGPGAVFKLGLKTACELSENNEDIIILIESDGTTNPNIMINMIKKIREENKDIVIASRFIKDGKYVNFPIERKLLSICANYLMGFLYPIPDVKDYTIFSRAYKVSFLKQAFDIYGDKLIEAKWFAANTELLIKISRLKNIKVAEVPLIYSYDKKKSKSALRIKREIKEYLRLIFNKL